MSKEYKNNQEVQEALDKMQKYIKEKLESDFPMKLEELSAFDTQGEGNSQKIVGILVADKQRYNFCISKNNPSIMLWRVR